MSLKVIEFETQNNHYVFDGVTGDVFAVDDILLDCIKLADGMSDERLTEELRNKYTDEKRIKAALAFINKMKRKGIFQDREEERKKWEYGISFEEDIVSAFIQAGYMQQIILNVTEDCNMRCKYCYLSEAYHYTRNRTTQMMSKKTAKKALDIFF